jgi:hypothetical protein
VLNTRQSPGILARVKARKPRPVGPARRVSGRKNGRLNGMRVCPDGNVGGTLPEEKAPQGGIPGAPPVRNKTGADPKGVNRREGSQTLRAERSGQAKPA